MSIAHLVFAVGSAVYIMIAIYYEERDLVDHFGSKYVEYQETVPMLVPGKKGKRTPRNVLNAN